VRNANFGIWIPFEHRAVGLDSRCPITCTKFPVGTFSGESAIKINKLGTLPSENLGNLPFKRDLNLFNLSSVSKDIGFMPNLQQYIVFCSHVSYDIIS